MVKKPSCRGFADPIRLMRPPSVPGICTIFATITPPSQTPAVCLPVVIAPSTARPHEGAQGQRRADASGARRRVTAAQSRRRSRIGGPRSAGGDEPTARGAFGPARDRGHITAQAARARLALDLRKTRKGPGVGCAGPGPDRRRQRQRSKRMGESASRDGGSQGCGDAGRASGLVGWTRRSTAQGSLRVAAHVGPRGCPLDAGPPP